MSITRNTTGQRLYDDFEDGDYTNNPTWTVVSSGSISVVTVDSDETIRLEQATNAAIITTPLNTAQDIVLFGMVRFPTGEPDGTVNMQLVNASTEGYGLEISHHESEFQFYRLPFANLGKVSQAYNNGVDYFAALSWNGSAVKAYLDGVQNLSATDSTYTAATLARLTGFGPVDGDGGNFKWVGAMDSFSITCDGLPAGYKFRVTGKNAGTATATESGGAATVDCSGLVFPGAQVEVLNGSDVVQETSTLTDDVWGGDSFSYSARRQVIWI